MLLQSLAGPLAAASIAAIAASSPHPACLLLPAGLHQSSPLHSTDRSSMSALPHPPLHPITTIYPPHNADDSQHQLAEGSMHGHDYCNRTPTSPDSQLPSSEANMICPPAPRKPRRAVLMRPLKRWLLLQDLDSEEYCSSDMESPAPEVITVSMEELEAAFRRRKPAADSYCSAETNGNCRKRKRNISTDPSIN